MSVKRHQLMHRRDGAAVAFATTNITDVWISGQATSALRPIAEKLCRRLRDHRERPAGDPLAGSAASAPAEMLHRAAA